MRYVDIEVAAHVANGRSVTGIELWDRRELLAVALRRLTPGERFRRRRVVQTIGVVHAANDGHMMHHLRGVRQVLADMHTRDGCRNRLEFAAHFSLGAFGFISKVSR